MAVCIASYYLKLTLLVAVNLIVIRCLPFLVHITVSQSALPIAKERPALFLTWALFTYEKFLDFATVALSFVCGKYCPIMN